MSLIALAGQRSTFRRLQRPHYQAIAERAPVSGVFPTDGPLHHLEIGIQAIQLSPYHAGPAAPQP
jgi:hypothetical protein